ncbi:FMN-binding negative transcriptional regulator [Ferrovibrio sp.]|uniref:FMN-binding negative transcriptional regulator n=1 Tax=Ferrovibrio sp. TaxID=1917215 RepID=UPI003D2670FD
MTSSLYTPAHFAAPDREAMLALIERYDFGILFVADGDDMQASHLPFMLDRSRGENGTLLAHVARANPIWKLLETRPALAVFQGEHGYVSPRWYETQPAVPTWNYAAVHAKGPARLVHEPAELKALVDRLSRVYEDPAQWSVASQPDRFIDGLARGIVGIEIEIADLRGKFKFSQNRPAADRANVLAALEGSSRHGDHALAAEMRKVLKA